MSDMSPEADKRASFADFGGRRPTAFVEADRHTARVQFLRRWIIICCVSAVALIGFILVFDPLHRIQLGFSVGHVGFKGTEIVMEHPRLSGLRTDGQPYEVKADKVIQDTTQSKLFRLEQVDALLGVKDGSTTRVQALKGLYNSENDLLTLSGQVHVENPGHYTMELVNAEVDMRGNNVDSHQASVVKIPGGRIEAQNIQISDADQRVTFTGGVHSIFKDKTSETSDAPDAPVISEATP